MNDILRAVGFAADKHVRQVRNHTNEPYVMHCIRVALAVSEAGFKPDVVVAALLHDTIEDTQTTREEIRDAFGEAVANMVEDLTDSPKEVGNRAQRKRMDADRIIASSAAVQSIKCADICDNLPSIVQYDPDFACYFVREADYLVPKLSKANTVLRSRALLEIEGAKTVLGSRMHDYHVDLTLEQYGEWYKRTRMHRAPFYRLGQQFYNELIHNQPPWPELFYEQNESKVLRMIMQQVKFKET